ncbi:MAG: hypothetical protein WCT03_06765 [Candidatus Obscuribacterales bacterium]
MIQKRDAEAASKNKPLAKEAAAASSNEKTTEETFARVVLTGQPPKEASAHALEIRLHNGVNISVQGSVPPT